MPCINGSILETRGMFTCSESEDRCQSKCRTLAVPALGQAGRASCAAAQGLGCRSSAKDVPFVQMVKSVVDSRKQ